MRKNSINSKNQKKIKHGFGKLVTPTHIHVGIFRFDKMDGPGTTIIIKNNDTSLANERLDKIQRRRSS